MPNITRTLGVFALTGALLGAAQYAIAQGPPIQPCSDRMVAMLDAKFGAGNYDNECQLWKHGAGDGTPGSSHTLTRIPPAGGAACGPEQIINWAKGQIVIEEPTDAVCDPVADGGCPARLAGGGASDDPQNRSIAEVSARNILAGGAMVITSSIVASFEGSEFTRFGCAANPPVGVDPSECGAPTPDRTYLLGDDTARHCAGIGTAGDAPPAPCSTDADCGGVAGSCTETGLVFKFNQNGDAVTTGDALCCDSIPGTLCEAIFLFREYPDRNRPVPQVQDRLSSTPWVAQGGRGAAMRTSETYVVPGQLQGQCTDGAFTPCSTDADCTAGVCDLAEKGFRISEATLLPSRAPNPGVCGFSQGVLVLTEVDADSGISTNCGLVSFYEPGTEGDMLASCFAKVQGAFTLPDLDCDGVWDDTDGDDQPGPDLCPFFSEVDHFIDSNGDGIGDECQCGDFTGEGDLTALDIGGTAQCANGQVACDPGLADANGDATTTSIDVSGVAQAVNGVLGPDEVICTRNP